MKHDESITGGEQIAGGHVTFNRERETSDPQILYLPLTAAFNSIAPEPCTKTRRITFLTFTAGHSQKVHESFSIQPHISNVTECALIKFVRVIIDGSRENTDNLVQCLEE
jgi:hypothetical protein